jgi:hypothetical protein
MSTLPIGPPKPQYVAIYDPATGRILRCGYWDPPHDPATEARTILDRAPDVDRERYDAGSGSLRPATAEEMAAAKDVEPVGLTVAAVIEWALQRQSGRPPSPAEVATARAEVEGIERRRRSTEPAGPRAQAAPTRPRG